MEVEGQREIIRLVFKELVMSDLYESNVASLLCVNPED